MRWHSWPVLPRVRAALAQNPLRVPLGRLEILQTDSARTHVVYAEPDLRSLDGRRLREVCRACYLFLFGLIDTIRFFFPKISPWGAIAGQVATDLVGSDVLELVNAASKEVGFLTDVR